MPRVVAPSKAAKAVKLRRETLLSTPAIAKRVGVSNHTAYKILKPYPWRGKREMSTDWSPGEVATLVRLFAAADQPDIRCALPRRKWGAIARKANSLGLRRHSRAYRDEAANAHPIIAMLERARRVKVIGRDVIARRSKIHVNQLCMWSLGRRMPKLDRVSAWAAALGYELTLRKIKD